MFNRHSVANYALTGVLLVYTLTAGWGLANAGLAGRLRDATSHSDVCDVSEVAWQTGSWGVSEIARKLNGAGNEGAWLSNIQRDVLRTAASAGVMEALPP